MAMILVVLGEVMAFKIEGVLTEIYCSFFSSSSSSQIDRLEHDISQELREVISDYLEALRMETEVREKAMAELSSSIKKHDEERREEIKKNIEVMDAMMKTMKKMSEDWDKRSGCSGSGPSV
ncbi:hypothetical protein OROGR_010587 [Orobanche gracilis]